MNAKSDTADLAAKQDSDRRVSRAILSLLIIVPPTSLGAWLLFHLYPGEPIGYAAYTFGKAVLYGLPLVWLLLVERQRPSISRPEGRGLAAGALWGLAIAVAIVAVFWVWGQHRVDPELVQEITTKNNIGTPVMYALSALAYSFINSLLEEYAFRWFIFRQFEKVMSSRLAVIAASLAFTAHHVLVLKAYFDWDITLVASFGVFMGGVIWSSLYLKYRSVWPGYVSHILADLAVFGIGAILIFG